MLTSSSPVRHQHADGGSPWSHARVPPPLPDPADRGRPGRLGPILHRPARHDDSADRGARSRTRRRRDPERGDHPTGRRHRSGSAITALTILAAVTLGACGGGDQPDWDGYTAYLNAEIRDTPATVEEIRKIHDGEFSCDDDANAYFVAQGVDRRGSAASSLAALYYLCGEDQARDVAQRVLGARGTDVISDELDVWESHAS